MRRRTLNVSLFASAVRPKLWPALFKSLESTSVDYEVVFAGNAVFGPLYILHPFQVDPGTYIRTGNTKPAQCYEVSRRHCRGEVVVWIADDCEFPNDVIGKAYKYWKLVGNEKLILSLQTKESGYKLPQGQLFDMNTHRLFAGNNDSPLMAPIGMMSRKFLDELGGFDARYICGQYENECVLRAMMKGAKVEIFGGPDCYVDIDHLRKSLEIGESKDEADFLNRPFASTYGHDRRTLERSWCKLRPMNYASRIMGGPVNVEDVYEVSPVQLDEFVPYKNEEITTKSQHQKGRWE